MSAVTNRFELWCQLKQLLPFYYKSVLVLPYLKCFHISLKEVYNFFGTPCRIRILPGYCTSSPSAISQQCQTNRPLCYLGRLYKKEKAKGDFDLLILKVYKFYMIDCPNANANVARYPSFCCEPWVFMLTCFFHEPLPD